MPTWKRQRLDGPKPILGDVTDGVNHGPSTRLPVWEHLDSSISKRRGKNIAVGRPHPDNEDIDDPIDLVSLAIPSPDDRGPAILDRLPPEVLDLLVRPTTDVNEAETDCFASLASFLSTLISRQVRRLTHVVFLRAK